MTKKHEELVEEIEDRFREVFDINEYVPLEEMIRWAITLTLSAVRDGRLDEELGVVGRVDLADIDEHLLLKWVLELPCHYGTLIALRPLTGTGKEED